MPRSSLLLALVLTVRVGALTLPSAPRCAGRRATPARMDLTEDAFQTAVSTNKLLGLIDGCCACTDGSWHLTYGAPDFTFVRPSGNPLNGAEEYAEFVNGPDLTITSARLVKLHKLSVGEVMAVAVLTQAAEFTYKGKRNDDVFVVTLVFEREDKEVGGEWQVSYMQRSQGRLPSEPPPEFKFSQDNSRSFPFPF